MATKKQNNKPSKETKIEPAIIVAIIALIGTLVTAILSSPLIIKLLESPTPTATSISVATQTDSVVNTLTPQHGQHIAFISNRDGNYEIYLMDKNGSNQTNLTHSATDELSYCWSPDGTRIAFVRSDQLIVLDVRTMKETQLTNVIVFNYTLSWSPDGNKILFASPEYGFGLYTINTDGTGLSKITSEDINPDINFPASWSPDSKKIAFAAYPNNSGADSNKGKVYVMNADGSNMLVIADIDNVSPIWSPSGNYIALTVIGVSPSEVTYPLYVVDINNKSQYKLTDWGTSPSWSPDSTKVFYTTHNGGIFVSGATGSLFPEITQGEASELSVSFDGTEIVYTCGGASSSIEKPFNSEICLIPIDNSYPAERLTTSSGFDYSPTWQP